MNATTMSAKPHPWRGRRVTNGTRSGTVYLNGTAGTIVVGEGKHSLMMPPGSPYVRRAYPLSHDWKLA